MKILVPVDFSKASSVAAVYAMKLAAKTGGEVKLVHVVLSTQSRRSGRLNSKVLEEAIIANACEDSLDFISGLISKTRRSPIPTFKVITGKSLEEAIDVHAKKLGCDLVVMGTKGASGLRKMLIGSNAATVINHSSVPVMTVPAQARFRGFKHIVYATDLTESESQLKLMVNFAIPFQATVHLLHVRNPASGKQVDVRKLTDDMKQSSGYQKIRVTVVEGDNVAAAIDEYVADVDADLLCMFTHHLNLRSVLFGKGVTRKMAFHTSVPLLSVIRHTT